MALLRIYGFSGRCVGAARQGHGHRMQGSRAASSVAASSTSWHWPRQRQGTGRSHHSSNTAVRAYATAQSRNALPQDIAVLGGGLTGLTTAHYLTKLLPSANITIYEKSGRLGGWIDTEKPQVKLPSGQVGHAVLERGGRMLRASRHAVYDELVFLDLVRTGCAFPVW